MQEQAPFELAGILSPPEIPASNLDFRKRILNCVSKLCLETDAVGAPQPLSYGLPSLSGPSALSPS